MNVLDVMHRDHENLKKLLGKAEEAEKGGEREQLLATIRAELAAHEVAEEQIVYPALRRHEEAKDIVMEGYEEHHVADVLLDELMDTKAESDVWKAKLKVLKESLEHHIEEEEGEMFKKARKVLERDQLEDLGRRMEAAKGTPAADA